MQYDILLKNGRVIDPLHETDAVLDVAIKDGKISAVAAGLNPAEAKATYDMTGLCVTPGLVDTHVHCYYTGGNAKSWAGEWSLQPDYFNFPGGVTTIVDAGSAGSLNFQHFRTTVLDRAKSRIYAFLNTADYGMASLEGEQFPEKNDIDAWVDCYEKNKDIIRGIKIAHYWGKDWGQVEGAKRVQARVPLPIMVDFGHFLKERPYDQLLMEKLDPGDITTHCFRAPVPVIDDNGKVYDYLFRAREKGIWFDLGHGTASFVLRSAVPAMRQGFIPDTFSSDSHVLDINSTVVTMAHLLSKLLACCDMPLIELFRRVTSNPAKMLHLDVDGVGNLNVGNAADIAVWSIQEGDFCFRDNFGGGICGNRRLVCEMTFRAGEIVWDASSRTVRPFEELPQWYGIDAPDERVIPTR